MTYGIPGPSSRSQGPVEIAAGIFWVGFLDTPTGMTCNPYLIREGEEALLIDAGSRPDFPTVMMKILQTGCRPRDIKAVVYTHYDPDVCGGAANLSELLGAADLSILSAHPNHMFMRHITTGARFTDLSDVGGSYKFSSGRTVRFIPTPYAHSAGAFAVFDEGSGTLFTSDLFGSYTVSRQTTIRIRPECRACDGEAPCAHEVECPLPGILEFHRQTFPSTLCLRNALETLHPLPFTRIAPQHGGIIGDRESAQFLFERLLSLDDVGVDGIRKRGLERHFSRW